MPIRLLKRSAMTARSVRESLPTSETNKTFRSTGMPRYPGQSDLTDLGRISPTVRSRSDCSAERLPPSARSSGWKHRGPDNARVVVGIGNAMDQNAVWLRCLSCSKLWMKRCRRNGGDTPSIRLRAIRLNLRAAHAWRIRFSTQHPVGCSPFAVSLWAEL
jgi:hypothetical protein